MSSKGFIHILLLFPILIIGILLILSSASKDDKQAGTPTTEPLPLSLTGDITKWKSYQDPNTQFTFSYPSHMPTFNQKEPSRGYSQDTPTFLSTLNESTWIEVQGPFPNSTDQDVTSYFKEKSRYLPKEGLSETEISKDERLPVKLGEKEATLIKSTALNEGNHYSLYFQTNIGIYHISIYSLYDNKLTQEDMTNILASIKLNPKPNLTLPIGWYWTSSKKCSIKFPTPSKDATLEGLAENEIGIIFQWRLTFSLQKNNNTAYIYVLCSPNTKKFTTDSIVTRIDEILENNSPTENPVLPSHIATKTQETRWGQKVYALTYILGEFSDLYTGTHYTFATQNYTYSIRLNDSLKDTELTKAIQVAFTNLDIN